MVKNPVVLVINSDFTRGIDFQLKPSNHQENNTPHCNDHLFYNFYTLDQDNQWWEIEEHFSQMT